MDYNELLQQLDWHQKCGQILRRDKSRCTCCGKPGYRNLSYMRCTTIDEFNALFEGYTFDNMNISTYIESAFSTDDNFDEFSVEFEIDEGKQFTFNDLYYPKAKYKRVHNKRPSSLGLSQMIALIYGFRPYSDKPLENCVIKRKDLNFKQLTIKFKEEKWPLHIARLIKYPYNLTEDYLITFSKDICAGGDNYFGTGAEFYDNYIINICHKNKHISILLYLQNYNPFFFRLNIHHKYYIEGHNPWDYEEEALTTLCEECHAKFHSTTTVPIYKDIRGTKVHVCDADTCPRCGGSGYLPQYSHVENGICFECWGEGVILPE